MRGRAALAAHPVLGVGFLFETCLLNQTFELFDGKRHAVDGLPVLFVFGLANCAASVRQVAGADVFPDPVCPLLIEDRNFVPEGVFLKISFIVGAAIFCRKRDAQCVADFLDLSDPADDLKF